MAPRGESIGPQTEDPGGLDGRSLHEGAGWRQTSKRVLEKFVLDRCSMVAGNLAYRLFLAVFPAVIALIGIVTLVHLDAKGLTSLLHGLDKALPPGAAMVFTAAVTAGINRSTGSAAAVVIGLLVALWSATSAMSALQVGLDIAYDVRADRQFLAKRIRAFPLILVSTVLGGIASALLVFGAPLATAIEHHVPLNGMSFAVVWTIVRWAVGIGAMTLLFSLYYYLGPNRRSRWRWISPGAALATVIFVAASLGFSVYVADFGTYGKTYGAFAGVVIVIFWMYLTGLAVMLCAELNAKLERQASADGATPAAGFRPRHLRSRPATHN